LWNVHSELHFLQIYNFVPAKKEEKNNKIKWKDTQSPEVSANTIYCIHILLTDNSNVYMKNSVLLS